MLQSSDEFARLVTGDHEHVSRVAIVVDGEIVADTYYSNDDVVLVDGSVSFDRSADTRASCSLTFQDVSGRAVEILDPVGGAEARPFRGIILSTGEPEWIPLGQYPINDSSSERTGTTVQISVQGNDRSDLVRWLPWAQAFVIPSGTDYFDAIKMVIDDRANRFTPVYNFATSDLTTPDMVFQDSDDPWTAVLKLAQAVGCEAYFDRYGVTNVPLIPDPDKIAPVFEMVEGQSGITLSPASRDTSVKDVFNGVICRGEAPWLLFPINGEIWDDDPLSPTFRGGPFGEKPEKIGDPMASTNAQCQLIAEAEFKKVKGVLEDITFNTLPDPRLEVGDVIDIKDELLGIKGRLVIETLTIPMISGNTQGTVRRRR